MNTIFRVGRTSVVSSLCSALIFLMAILMCPIDARAQKRGEQSNPSASSEASESDISGMYSFLRDGEFVQITVENQAPPNSGKAKNDRSAKVTGFISRFGDGESDKGEFLDHFFTRGSLNGNRITFATKQIHGVWFEFSGTVGRGAGKSRADEGYYVVSGTLTQNVKTSDDKSSSRSREISMKLLPDMNDDAAAAKR
jgi:hypothetical protein